jgi:tol-pal system protein YbgF
MKARVDMRIRGLVSVLTVAALLGGAAPAFAQSAVVERLDRLERDMNQLQRQVYRGGGGAGGAPMAVTPAPNAVDTELRMDQLENQMRTLTGQIEELNYSITQMKQRMDRFSGDVDVRFQELEKGGSHGGENASAAPAPSTPPAPAGRPGAAASSAARPNPAGDPGVLQTPRGGAAPAPAAPPQQSAAVEPDALTGGSAQDQYNRAFGLLRQADYPAAEKALKSFLQRYPNDPLAGNAQYWLGETFYVRGDYNNAAAAFAEAYRKYPQGGKGPDSLLKLAMALGNIGQKRDACMTLSQLDKDFPKSSANIAERAKAERQRLECGR